VAVHQPLPLVGVIDLGGRNLQDRAEHLDPGGLNAGNQLVEVRDAKGDMPQTLHVGTAQVVRTRAGRRAVVDQLDSRSAVGLQENDFGFGRRQARCRLDPGAADDGMLGRPQTQNVPVKGHHFLHVADDKVDVVQSLDHWATFILRFLAAPAR
jgi:hypothetical protein